MTTQIQTSLICPNLGNDADTEPHEFQFEFSATPRDDGQITIAYEIPSKCSVCKHEFSEDDKEQLLADISTEINQHVIKDKRHL
jgi:hypothetical protein